MLHTFTSGNSFFSRPKAYYSFIEDRNVYKIMSSLRTIRRRTPDTSYTHTLAYSLAAWVKTPETPRRTSAHCRNSDRTLATSCSTLKCCPAASKTQLFLCFQRLQQVRMTKASKSRLTRLTARRLRRLLVHQFSKVLLGAGAGHTSPSA